MRRCGDVDPPSLARLFPFPFVIGTNRGREQWRERERVPVLCRAPLVSWGAVSNVENTPNLFFDSPEPSNASSASCPPRGGEGRRESRRGLASRRHNKSRVDDASLRRSRSAPSPDLAPAATAAAGREPQPSASPGRCRQEAHRSEKVRVVRSASTFTAATGVFALATWPRFVRVSAGLLATWSINGDEEWPSRFGDMYLQHASSGS